VNKFLSQRPSESDRSRPVFHGPVK